MPRNDPIWTIDELGARVALALSVDYEGPPNSRVRDVPDRRTIRYYTTLGLIDRPAEIRGRTAYYGRRHLLQLVAIKRLQARGLSLAQVQQRMVGATAATLRTLARLPPDLESPGTPAAQSAPAPRREAFWAAAPAAAPAESGNGEQPGAEAGAAQHSSRSLGGAGPGDLLTNAAVPLQGLRLCDDVTLLLAAIRPIDEEDIQAIRTVAAPLLKLLETRRLLGPRKERGT